MTCACSININGTKADWCYDLKLYTWPRCPRISTCITQARIQMRTHQQRAVYWWCTLPFICVQFWPDRLRQSRSCRSSLSVNATPPKIQLIGANVDVCRMYLHTRGIPFLVTYMRTKYETCSVYFPNNEKGSVGIEWTASDHANQPAYALQIRCIPSNEFVASANDNEDDAGAAAASRKILQLNTT